MTNPNDPAFNGLPGSGSPGLTKREYFAALAMQGLIFRAFDFSMSEDVSSRAVTLADSLIAELTKEVK